MKKLFKEKMSEVIYTKSKNRQCCQPLRLLRFGLSVLLLALVFIQSSCKKEDCDNPRNPECSNYDACIDAVETSADFGFYTRSNSSAFGTIYFPLRDTIFLFSAPDAGSVWFRAHDSNMDRYEWKIGSDSRVFTDSVFHLNMTNLPQEYHLDAQLKVRNFKASTDCFPDDTGIAEVEKIIVFKRVYNGPFPMQNHIVDSLNHTHIPIYGKFFGSYTDDPTDTCTIQILSIWPKLHVRSACATDLLFPCNGETFFYHQNGFLFHGNALECQGSGFSIGNLDLADKNKLTISVRKFENSEPKILRTWVGRRI